MSYNKILFNVAAILITAAFTAFEFTGCSGSPTSSGTTVPNTVAMAGLSFSPVSLTVSKGTTVTFKNNDGGTVHTATSDANTWNTGDIAGGSSATITFSTAGTFPYHCKYHVSMGMTGTIVVQ